MELMQSTISEHEHDGMRFFAARTGAKDVVSVSGSVHGGFYHSSADKRLVQRVLVGILDADTKNRSKDSLREELARRGASISFSTDADRTHFNASCLPEDIRFVCDLIVECLHQALLRKSEFENEVKRVQAEIAEAKSETETQGAHAFNRLVFDPKHVNFSETFAKSERDLKSITRADLVSFTKTIGKGGLIFAIVGDINPEAALRTARSSFARLPEGTSVVPSKPVNAKLPMQSESLVSIADKKNVDTFIGTAIPITYNDDRYIPFLVLINMLGGNSFSSHLMRTIRARDGLAYAIFAQAYGFSNGADGALRINALFSPDKFRYSVDATLKELHAFFNSGIDGEPLAHTQDRLVGSFALSFSTSRGIASMLHRIGIEGKSLSYLDEYPALIRAVTLDDLHTASLLAQLDKLSLAASGTLKK